MLIMPQAELARLLWYLRWSEGEVAQIKSNFNAVVAAQINGMLEPPEQTADLNGPMPINPTKSIYWAEWMSQQERAYKVIDRERRIRRAWNAIKKADQEEIILAFCVPIFPARKAFGIHGNLADRTECAQRLYQSRRRRLPFSIFLDRLARDSFRPANRATLYRRAGEIAVQCEARARACAERYLWAVRGYDATET
jgi:hypothetical protein